MPSWPITAVPRQLDHRTGTIPDDPGRLLDLANVLDALPDPRRRQGRRYRLDPVLAPCTAAVLSGAATLAAIARHVACLPDEVRHRPGPRHGRPRSDGSWHVEAHQHTRDTPLAEDASTIRTGNTSRAMATFRTIAIVLVRLTGWANTAPRRRLP